MKIKCHHPQKELSYETSLIGRWGNQVLMSDPVMSHSALFAELSGKTSPIWTPMGSKPGPSPLRHSASPSPPLPGGPPDGPRSCSRRDELSLSPSCVVFICLSLGLPAQVSDLLGATRKGCWELISLCRRWRETVETEMVFKPIRGGEWGAVSCSSDPFKTTERRHSARIPSAEHVSY